jgi:hypothetical protein
MVWEDGVWPRDVLHAVLLQLEAPRDLCSCRAVRSDWREAASAGPLWDAAWERDPRLSGRPARTACGAASLAPPPPRYPSFCRFAVRVRAHRCYRWAELQKGWDRLEELLAACTGGEGAAFPGAGCASPGPDTAPATGEIVRSPRRDGQAVHGSVQSSVQARRLAAILTNRDWELLYDCLRLLQIECAESLGACIAPGGHGHVRGCVQGRVHNGEGYVQGRVHSEDGCVHTDEALLLRLLSGFDSFSRWLAAVSSAFDHQPGSCCACHLGCLVAAQRGSEMVDRGQHTPTLCAGGLAAFRSAVVLRPEIEVSLCRHVARAQESLLLHGGWTVESGRLMQTLIE